MSKLIHTEITLKLSCNVEADTPEQAKERARWLALNVATVFPNAIIPKPEGDYRFEEVVIIAERESVEVA